MENKKLIKESIENKYLRTNIKYSLFAVFVTLIPLILLIPFKEKTSIIMFFLITVMFIFIMFTLYFIVQVATLNDDYETYKLYTVKFDELSDLNKRRKSFKLEFEGTKIQTKNFFSNRNFSLFSCEKYLNQDVDVLYSESLEKVIVIKIK